MNPDIWNGGFRCPASRPRAGIRHHRDGGGLPTAADHGWQVPIVPITGLPLGSLQYRPEQQSASSLQGEPSSIHGPGPARPLSDERAITTGAIYAVRAATRARKARRAYSGDGASTGSGASALGVDLGFIFEFYPRSVIRPVAEVKALLG